MRAVIAAGLIALPSAFSPVDASGFQQARLPSGRMADRGYSKPEAGVQSAVWEIPDSEGRISLLHTWRISYSRLEFQRIPPGERYEAVLDLSVRLLDAKGKTELKNRERERLDAWAAFDTSIVATALSYDSSRSPRLWIQGAGLHPIGGDASLKPGGSVLPMLKLQQPGRDPRTVYGPNHPLRPFEAEFIPLKRHGGSPETLWDEAALSAPDNAPSMTLDLQNLGRTVPYGREFDLLVVWNPEVSESEPSAIQFRDAADPAKPPLLVQPIVPVSEGGELSRNDGGPNLDPRRMTDLQGFELLRTDDREGVRLRAVAAVEGVEGAYRMAVVRVDGTKLPNTAMTVSLLSGYSAGEAGGGVEWGTRKLVSLWPDMPRSLLSLEKALKLLEHLAGKDQVERWLRGSREEQLEAFHAYWKSKDPTPETDLNEIMVEYYRRADDASRRFTTPGSDGALGDQGRSLMLYGEPDSIQREFPSGKPAVEIWAYPDFVLVFEATSGFGDFRLLERRAK